MKKFAVALALIAGAALLLAAPVEPFQRCEGFVREYGQAMPNGAAADQFSVVTLNLYEVTDLNAIDRDWQRLDEAREADLILLQEVVEEPDGRGLIEAWAKRSGFHGVFASGYPGDDGPGRGLAILSRYRLSGVTTVKLKAFNLRFRSRCRIGLLATAETPIGPVRVANMHLDTRINSIERVQQMHPVMEALQGWPGPAILGGDLNTNHFYWFANVVPFPYLQPQARAVRSALERQGFGTPFRGTGATHDLGMTLDWIYLKGLNATGRGIQPMEFTDHHALWVTLKGISDGKDSVAEPGSPPKAE